MLPPDLPVACITQARPCTYFLTLLSSSLVSQLLQLLKPRKVVPLPNTKLNDEGPLQMMMRESGSTDNVEQQLAQQGVTDVRVERLGVPGEALAIAL